MGDPHELYPVNTIPAIAWALRLYFLKKPGPKDKRIMELTFPAGKHKIRKRTKGEHEIVVWYANKEVFVRAKCTFDKKCPFNSERIEGKKRDELMNIGWEGTKDRQFFKAITKWLLSIGLDYVTLVRALSTMCNRKVKIPMTTKYDRTFVNFEEYRKNKWPEDAKPADKSKFLEEVLVRVCFWIQSADDVGALKGSKKRTSEK